MIVATGNVKGGVAKTTSAVFIAHGLKADGSRVCIVDADPRRSASDWSERAGDFWTVPVFPWSDSAIVRRVRGIQKSWGEDSHRSPPRRVPLYTIQITPAYCW